MQFVPDYFKTQEMCKKVVEEYPQQLEFVPDQYTLEMCDDAVRMKTWLLKSIPDQFKTLEMCDKTVRYHYFSLQYVPDWFARLKQIGLWDDDDNDDDVDEIIEWYEGYQKRNAQKAKIEKELMPTAWHPSRWWAWYAPEDEKKETERLWKQTI